jgi:two-component system cell cycle response regulator
MTGRILIVDPNERSRSALAEMLVSARYLVLTAGSGAEALALASETRPSVVVIDVRLRDMSGVEACRRLREATPSEHLPVMMVVSGGVPEEGLAALDAGADDFLTRPVDEVTLLARVRSLLRARETARDFETMGGGWLDIAQEAREMRAAAPVYAPPPQGRLPGMAETGPAFEGPGGVLGVFGGGGAAATPRPAVGVGRRVGLICGPLVGAQDLAARLAGPLGGRPAILGRDAALGPREGASVPELFVIDVDLGARSGGLRLMSELRSRPRTRHAAFLVLLPPRDSERAATALDLGASDVCHMPLSLDELAIRIRTQLSRKHRADRMREMLDAGLKLAAIDPLTGLHNRRYGLQHLDRVTAAARPGGRQAGVIVMDIDHFKRVNDSHGHAAGDAVLARVAQELRLGLRAEDMVCRIGGEEFLAVLPDTSARDLRAVAERLRRAVADIVVPIAGGAELRATLSLGAALMEPTERSAAPVLERADRALYEAKRGGRNRISAP